MRFMMMVKATPDSERGIPPKRELIEAIGKLSAEGIQAGILLDTGGLLPSSTGARVHVSGGEVTVTDGPFAETKELVGGYAILKASSRAEAIELGRNFMQLHADILGSSFEGELEIRQMADFGPGGDCSGDERQAVQAARG
jgi:hypothetical protein